jgi:hypothetical protein
MHRLEMLDSIHLDREAEILRHIWYEGKTTPITLAGLLDLELTTVYQCIEDLSLRGIMFKFFDSPQGKDFSVYCLTKKIHRILQENLEGTSRYKLRKFWMSFQREELKWLGSLLHN